MPRTHRKIRHTPFLVLACIGSVFTGVNISSAQAPSQSAKRHLQAKLPVVVNPDAPIKDYDGNTYRTVRIGNQIWMAENLKSTHYSDGTPMASFTYNNDEANVNTFGRLYSWRIVMNGAGSSNTNPSHVQGIAPIGWHVPSRAEWQQLADYLGGLQVAGGKMKSTGTTLWSAPNAGATDEVGFNALPAGMHDFTGIFQWLGDHCVFAASTGNLTTEVVAIMLQSSTATVTIGNFHPVDAVSVRCVKD